MRRDPLRTLIRRIDERDDAEHPLVLLHPGALGTDVYHRIGEHLPESRSLRVVDMEAIDAYYGAAFGEWHEDVSVEGLAASVLDAVRDTLELRAGQWTLAGWSFGGVIAHSLAHALDASEVPDRLVLLDSIAPVPGYLHDPEEDLAPELVLAWFGFYLGAKRGVSVPEADYSDVELSEGLRRLLDLAVEAGALPPGTSYPGLRKVFDVYNAGLLRNNRITRGHRPTPGSVPLTLVRPRAGLLDTPRPLGWERLYEHVPVVRCPGNHYSMLHEREPASLLAAVLADPCARSSEDSA
ncbi:thioesterase domain-containing protein [Actinopolyspora mortivallis]|uniref:thioesterase domain-containing protein n=1 Tax=Actinopolyspora mortivallis TaxID=33906 RepID=UPI000371AE76|nr:thioesterase domain-containing protein [Actinopolyspora mortivallis]